MIYHNESRVNIEFGAAVAAAAVADSVSADISTAIRSSYLRKYADSAVWQ